jgi:hypothetical protein
METSRPTTNLERVPLHARGESRRISGMKEKRRVLFKIGECDPIVSFE